jgi:long-chain acyl-CoA synthetase
MTNKINQVVSRSQEQLDNALLGRTLPSLLNTPSSSTGLLNQWTEKGWRSLSRQKFREAIESFALGLLNLNLEKGDRIAFLMQSDVNFCIADFGSLLANLVNVPIDPTQTLENIIFVLKHSEAKVLMISNLDLLAQIVPYLWHVPELKYVIVADVSAEWEETRSQWMSSRLTPLNHESQPTQEAPSESACLCIPMALHPAPHHVSCSIFPQCIQLTSLEEIQTQRKPQDSTAKIEQLIEELYGAIAPHQLATLIYIPGETGELQGVMLTHENLSANALTAFASLPNLKFGKDEVVLSFLPLTHVFARTQLYGHVYYGHQIYFSHPNRVMKHFKEVRPTLLATVPLLLEKVHAKTVERATKSKFMVERLLLRWALGLANQYELGGSPKRRYRLLLQLANWLVFSRWRRSVFGDRLKSVWSGGAALKADLANWFAAAGVTILQGYGLTQTSAVICCNRGALNRAGTVGMPIAGVDLAIAPDHEILVRGPYVTQGYYKNPTATQRDIDAQGWFHTGDLGVWTDEGFLKITSVKKALFKLCTGKYITPQPIETRLQQSAWVERAIVVGADQKFCAALIFPNIEYLHKYALQLDLDLPINGLLHHPSIIELYQTIVDAANCHLPYWETIKRFQLINAMLTVDNGLLTPAHTIHRTNILTAFASEIQALYQENVLTRKTDEAHGMVHTVPSSANSSAACPTFAQSLNPRLTT